MLASPTNMSPPEHKKAKRRRAQYTNPFQSAIHSFLTSYLSHSRTPEIDDTDADALISTIPKRYTIYPPLLLLPPNVFTSTPSWESFTSNLMPHDFQTLYKAIVNAFKPPGSITHIALNSPISLTTSSGAENVTRSPTRIIPLYGNFGPLSQFCGSGDLLSQPNRADLDAAFWVSTTQPTGVFQTWAPLHTMFSRGNISEKARILGHQSTFDGLDSEDGALGQDLSNIAVVDMYVGIGYFAFPYLRRGVGRLFGWEVNGWSVEGLRRGCRRNGWDCVVLTVDKDGVVIDREGRVGEQALECLAEVLSRNRELKLVVFHGDNRWAGRIMERLRELSQRGEKNPQGDDSWPGVRHVNLGLLPTSRLSWESALNMLDRQRGGWVHVHENVDLNQMEQKREFIVQTFGAYWENTSKVSCSHIEQVKTYGPGIMHCVFDIHAEPKGGSDSSFENG
jgi:tRNA wybutosine-synthesizing protein 2